MWKSIWKSNFISNYYGILFTGVGVYAAASSWSILLPTIYDIRYFNVNNNQLVVKEDKIYYQSESAGGTNSMEYIRVLINNVEVASCGGYYARCTNEE